MKHEVLSGQTDYTVLVKMRDDTGAPATGLAHTDIDIAYARVETDNDVTTADVAPADLANLTAAHSDWGWEEVSPTDHPGLYRLDIADAVFASGAWSAVVTVTGTGLDPADLEFVMVPNAPLTGVLLAPTTHTSAVIPTVTTTGTATAVTTVNGLAANVITAASIASDAGNEIADAILNRDASGSTTNSTLGAIVNDWENGGRLDLIIDDILVDTGTTLQGELDGIQADTEDIQSRLPAALTADGNIKADALRVNGSATAASNIVVVFATDFATAYSTSSDQWVVSASAVASVTGNVGGNVAGSVASVTAGVTLANDAITAAKFDESTAFPLTAVDTGSTAVARTGADADTLKTLSDQLDAKASQASVDTVDTVVDSILDDTGTAGVVVAAASKTGYRLSSTGVADLLTTALTEAYAADGAAFTLSEALFMIYSAVMEFSISGTTLTCKKLDGTTTAMTVTLDDDTAPTSRTRSG